MLFPQSFIDDLRLQADIVQVIQDYVPLKRAGNSYKGLCPFHGEKTPSFIVHRDKGFFHCFGCGVGGDVFKFLELHEKVGFQEAVRLLAQRFGLALPEMPGDDASPDDVRDREALLKIHEVAGAWFQEQLRSPAGARVRRVLQDRGLAEKTIEQLMVGYAPPSRDALKRHLRDRGFDGRLQVRSGLVLERENGETIDRFRGRLMFAICRESGSVVAFAGRALEAEQQPKYLNSPETPIYSKSRTLYGLNLSKPAIRRSGYAVLVEGYFDFAVPFQAGGLPVVASCGTALTPQQAHLLRRFTTKVVLSYDPDSAGQGAAARSSELLVAEGFQVNVAALPAGQDPDVFVRRQGVEAYAEALKASRPYLEFLLDRAAQAHDLANDEARREFLREMLAVAARIPDAAGRDQFADRLAHKARITEDVVRAEIRKAAVERRTALTTRELPNYGQVKPAEKGLIWHLINEPAAAIPAMGELEDADLKHLPTRHVLEAAREISEQPAEAVPSALLTRLNTEEAALVSAMAAVPEPPVMTASDCIREIRRLRFERERSALQREIERLRDEPGSEATIVELYQRKVSLQHQIELLR
ncbi:MAG: DNA primase [Bacteroidales bacterium]